ncbi:MAG: DNA-processing protein DprA [Lachnospiraceae bacterium]|nr:DNA-processing protein DprA [Lachnospiraceae bacterium]
MGERIEYACWLHHIPGIGNKTIQKLVEYAGEEKEVYELSEKAAGQLLTKRQLQSFLLWQRTREPGRVYEQIQRKRIRFLPCFSEQYPEQLRNIPDRPYGIYLAGKDIPKQTGLTALIGARRCSAYGERMAERIGRELAEHGIGVISGMARGVDGIGQWAAIEAGGYTVSVLGCGVDVCYPPENRRLYERCLSEGTLLSEYVPGTQPEAGNFPPRNRIISGLSANVIVVEAREKSGTFITVDMALEQGREVYAVPGRLTDTLSAGCMRLISQGAQIFWSVEEMSECPGQKLKSEGTAGKESWEDAEKRLLQNGLGDSLERELYGLCDCYPRSLMELYEMLNQKEGGRKVPMEQVVQAIMNLNVCGMLTETGKNYYYRRV